MPETPSQNSLCHYAKMEGRRVLQIFAATAASYIVTPLLLGEVNRRAEGRDLAFEAIAVSTVVSLTYAIYLFPCFISAAMGKGVLSTTGKPCFTRDTLHKICTTVLVLSTATWSFYIMAKTVFDGKIGLLSPSHILDGYKYASETTMIRAVIAGTVHLIGSVAGYLLLRRLCEPKEQQADSVITLFTRKSDIKDI